MDDYYEESADEYGDKAFLCFMLVLTCLLCFAVGGCVGHDMGQSTGRDEMWKQAVERNKAETIETSGGTFYRWKQ